MKSSGLLVLLLLLTNILYAQTIRINEPEFDGNVIYANDTVGNGVPLEKLESDSKTSGTLKTIVSGKATSISFVKNCCSSVRITKKSNLNFLVPFFDREDPVEYIKVFKLKKEKKSRSVKTIEVKMKIIGIGDAEDVDTDYLKFTYQKYGARSYLITIDTLEPGEYAITVSSGKTGTFYLFGID